MPANADIAKGDTKLDEKKLATKPAEPAAEGATAAPKKKRNKKKKKKKPVPRGINVIPVEEYRDRGTGQTFPPTRVVSTLYPDDDYPLGELMDHPFEEGKGRRTDTEKMAMEKNLEFAQRLKDTREAAEIHRQVRQSAQRFIQPGKTMTEICEHIESTNLRLLGFDPQNPLARSWGFPTGCSINHCAAHWTPNSGDTTVLKRDDIVKIDFGTQINGHIIDCAFTFSFDPMHDKLMEAVKAATNAGIKKMGIDARLSEIGEEIQETMESYSCEYNGQLHPVKAIRNLNGHSIGSYQIHAGKSVPIVKNDSTIKMEENELYAIETFGSVMGRGKVIEDGACSHYMKNFGLPDNIRVRNKNAQNLLNFINKRFSTLAFCRRWLDGEGQTKHLMPLKQLVNQDIIEEYPPLCDIKGSYTAQYEHTILLRPTCKEVVSRGPDF